MDFLIDEASGGDVAPAAADAPPWRVLIVDDAQEVHDATAFALRGFTFEGRGIELLHALSAADAKELLRRCDDIAVAIVDVVMENERAGIQLIDWMRNQQANHLTRVILRTGQPGHAPESDVILEHEIDGYKEKSEMTRTRLVTMLVTSLRGYRQLRALDHHEAGLRRLVDGLGNLLNTRDVAGLAATMIDQLAALLDVPGAGAVCVNETAADAPAAGGADAGDLALIATRGGYPADGAGTARDLAEGTARQLQRTTEALFTVPPKADAFLERANRGDLRVNVSLEDESRVLDKLAMRIAYSVLLAVGVLSATILYSFANEWRLAAVVLVLAAPLAFALYRSFRNKRTLPGNPQFTRQGMRERQND